MCQAVVTIGPEGSPGRGANLMVKHNIGRLPVVKNGKVIGIFSRSDAIADFYGLCPLGTQFSKGCKKPHYYPDANPTFGSNSKVECVTDAGFPKAFR